MKINIYTHNYISDEQNTRYLYFSMKLKATKTRTITEDDKIAPKQHLDLDLHHNLISKTAITVKYHAIVTPLGYAHLLLV